MNFYVLHSLYPKTTLQKLSGGEIQQIPLETHRSALVKIITFIHLYKGASVQAKSKNNSTHLQWLPYDMNKIPFDSHFSET